MYNFMVGLVSILIGFCVTAILVVMYLILVGLYVPLEEQANNIVLVMVTMIVSLTTGVIGCITAMWFYDKNKKEWYLKC